MNDNQFFHQMFFSLNSQILQHLMLPFAVFYILMVLNLFATQFSRNAQLVRDASISAIVLDISGIFNSRFESIASLGAGNGGLMAMLFLLLLHISIPLIQGLWYKRTGGLDMIHPLISDTGRRVIELYIGFVIIFSNGVTMLNLFSAVRGG